MKINLKAWFRVSLPVKQKEFIVVILKTLICLNHDTACEALTQKPSVDLWFC